MEIIIMKNFMKMFLVLLVFMEKKAETFVFFMALYVFFKVFGLKQASLVHSLWPGLYSFPLLTQNNDNRFNEVQNLGCLWAKLRRDSKMITIILKQLSLAPKNLKIYSHLMTRTLNRVER
jgi:hypothetical protein